MPLGVRTAPLGALEVPGAPYALSVLRVGRCTPPAPDGTFSADGSVTLIRGGPLTLLVDTGGPWAGGELLEQLASRGVTPGDVTHVVCTHGHCDHVGNLGLFPGARWVLGTEVSEGRGRFLPTPLARGEPLRLDGERLEVVPTPGHCPEHVSLLLRGTQLGTVLVAGDLFEEEEDEEGWRRWSWHPEKQQRSREWALGVADVIVPGHGPPFRVFRAGTREGEGGGTSS